MTAMAGIVRPDGLEFYTDGAVYGSPGGSLLMTTQKVHFDPHMPFIMASRGEHLLCASHRFLCDSQICNDFDNLVDLMPALLRAAAGSAPKLNVDINLSVLFGGWSQRSGMWELYRSFVAGEAPDRLDDGSAEVERQKKGFHFEPAVEVSLLATCGLLKNGALDLRTGDASVIQFFECQRATTYQFSRPESSGKGCIVGGFIQKTVLTRDGATTEIIHRWPLDEIGKPLGGLRLGNEARQVGGVEGI